MRAGINTAKSEFLGDIANFATDVSHRFLTQAGYPEADLIFALARKLIRGADYSDDHLQLEQAFQSLSHEDRDALLAFLTNTSLLSDPSLPPDPVEAMEKAMNMHWVKLFGLGAVGDMAAARRQLGPENAELLEAFINRRVDGFWERDALSEKLDAEPLSDEDMRIVAHYGLTLGDGSTLSAVISFANVETLRHCLANKELQLPADAVAILQDGLNRDLKRVHPDRAGVSIMGWLT